MSKCTTTRNIILHANSNNIRCEQTARSHYETRLRRPKEKQRSSSSFTKLSQIGVLGIVLCSFLLTISWEISPVNGKLTRKTYTVWDLTPDEFADLLKQEKDLQKRKRNFDYFLRRRAKKTKELLPSPLDYDGQGNGRFSNTHNNLGNVRISFYSNTFI